VAELLQHAKELHLTGLPQKFEEQNKTPRRWERAKLARLRSPIAPDEPIAEFPACYVQLAITRAGVARVVTYGPGSVIVERDKKARARPQKRKLKKPAGKKPRTRR
jgi:hypothetical protein